MTSPTAPEGGAGAVPGSPLDVAELERLANEMFRAGIDGLHALAPEAAGGPSGPLTPSAIPPTGPVLAAPSSVPGVPSFAGGPGGPSPAGAAAFPGVPAVPTPAGLPASAGAPGLPSAPDLPSSSGPPGLPAVPGASSFGGAPGLSSVPGASSFGGTPGLPSAPGAPASSGAPGFASAPGTATLGAAPGLPSAAPPGPPSGSLAPFGGPSDLVVDGRSLSLSELGLAGPRVPGLSAPGGALYVLDELGTHAHPGLPATQSGHADTPTSLASPAHPAFDADLVRADFPILSELVHGKPLVWLDNAATTQKPLAVIERLERFYRTENSNIHRAAHELAARATDAYESARDTCARFLGAGSSEEIVFVRGATEAINLVAKTWGIANLGPGDEILVTWLEHHANIVPWQQLCQVTGAELRVAPVDDSGQVLLGEFERLLGPRTKLVSVSQVSNALGTITPAAEMVQIAHRHGAKVLVDGAQAVSHMAVDVQALDCDWYAFSGHKVFGPTGIGVLYGKADVLEEMQPWQGGGNMIRDVTFEQTLYQDAPFKFEAGTGNLADAVGLGAAIDYVQTIGLDVIAAHEHELLEHATARLRQLPGVHIIGTAAEKAGVLSFVIDGFETAAIGTALDQEGIAVRTGHHCAQPILRRFGQEGTVRASFALYNTHADVDALIAALTRIVSRGVPV